MWLVRAMVLLHDKGDTVCCARRDETPFIGCPFRALALRAAQSIALLRAVTGSNVGQSGFAVKSL